MSNQQHEAREQAMFFRMARAWLPEQMRNLIWSSLSGERLKSPAQAARAKAQGNIPGIPDIFFAHARLGYHGLFIEMKRPANKAIGVAKGTVSAEQKAMLAALNDAKYLAVVAYGAEEAMNILRDYMLSAGENNDVED